MIEATTSVVPSLLAEMTLTGVLNDIKNVGLIFIGFSMVIFVHELGHFAVAKWCGIRVEKFAIGFGKELAGFTRGETRYSFNLLPLGGYVKMLGQEDFAVDKSGEWKVKEDPRSFTSKPVRQRAAVVSAGVIMNVLFAALLFMIVFMAGMEVMDNVVGWVIPGSPADEAGLRSGDRVLAINGATIDEFVDIMMAVVLAPPGEPLGFMVERKAGLLFRIGEDQTDVTKAAAALDEGRISDGLREAFTRHGQSLSAEAQVLEDQPESRWRIVGAERRFIAAKGASGLAIYEAKKLEIPITPRHDDKRNMLQIGIVNPFTHEVRQALPQPELLTAMDFTLDASFKQTLDARSISESLRNEFAQHEITLAEDDVILVYAAGENWQILTAGRSYAIKLENDALVVYHDQNLQAGDTIIRVGAREYPDPLVIASIVANALGAEVEIVVERPDPSGSGITHEVTCYLRGRMGFLPTGKRPAGAGDLLGLIPRREIIFIAPESPGATAGFAIGDVVVSWGEVAQPTAQEIQQINASNAGHPIAVRVRRGETEKTLTIQPKAKWKLFGSDEPPVIGLGLDWQEADRVVVAKIRETAEDGKPTPAAALQMPRGSTILAVDDEPVRTWLELVDRFRAKAGDSVQITYRYGDDPPKTRPMQIPDSMTTSLTDENGEPVVMPSSAMVLAVAGQESVTVANDDGKERTYQVSSLKGLGTALARRVGEETEIRYYDPSAGVERTATMQVTARNADPWLRRVVYRHLLSLSPQYRLLQKTNPLSALSVGAKKTFYFIVNAYKTMEAMIWTRSIGMEHISGPVGIVKIGAGAADAGMVRLLYFLGMLSANLAVINFLPLPIVDGGLMIFLMIEKLKGSPVSLKTQVVTQIIGLALIISIFVYVTVADIAKML